jgi:glycosyltransferase involved in cell wall biosynthesis
MVSVVMAVKNGGQIMREAIDSILNQTFTDFEFIIINDGSTDETLEVLAEYSDPRIQVYSQENRGVAITANRGVCLAAGKYIARQDHDDISLLTRLEKQVAYLEENPQVGLLGTAAEIWVDNVPTGRFHDHPVNNAQLKLELLFDNPFINTSTMFRKTIINEIGLYNPISLITPLDDFDFISRASQKFEIANLPNRLVIYRESRESLTSAFRSSNSVSQLALKAKLARITSANIAALLNLPPESVISKSWGHLVSIDKFRDKGVAYQDIYQVFSNAFAKLDSLYQSALTNEMRAIKIDHLEYLWYVNPGVANFYEKNYFFVKGRLCDAPCM